MSYNAWSVIAGEVPTTAKWNYLGGNDAEFKANIDQLFADKTLHHATDGATVTFDISVSKLWDVVLGGNRTLAVSGVTVGIPFAIRLVQDNTGGRTVTWFGNAGVDIRFPSDTEPPLTPDPNAVDIFVFLPTADGKYDCLFAGFGLV